MKRPKPPEHLTDEALLEWHRVCDELEELGHLKRCERALLTLYCETWQANQTVAKHVDKHGPIVKYPNGVVGQSPHYKTQQETGRALCKMLDQLGLTPQARKFDQSKKTEETPAADLEF